MLTPHGQAYFSSFLLSREVCILDIPGRNVISCNSFPTSFPSLKPYRVSCQQTACRDSPPVPIALQGTGTDIQPLAHFLTCEEVLTAKERFVCLCYFLYSLAYSADSGQHHLHIVHLHVQISYLFHILHVYLLNLFFSAFDFFILVWSNLSTSSRL